jgi:hypothetical protein
MDGLKGNAMKNWWNSFKPKGRKYIATFVTGAVLYAAGWVAIRWGFTMPMELPGFAAVLGGAIAGWLIPEKDTG